MLFIKANLRSVYHVNFALRNAMSLKKKKKKYRSRLQLRYSLVSLLKLLASAADSQLGGRDIDNILAQRFCHDFKARYNIDAHANARAYLRLLAEVEKLKKQMSANSTTLPLNIECFMDEKDVHGEMKRADMEELCAHLFQRVEATLKQCLADSSKWCWPAIIKFMSCGERIRQRDFYSRIRRITMDRVFFFQS